MIKNKKGSILVEKILMTAFAVAGGAAVITYGVGVINASKTTNISLDGGVVTTNSSGVQLIAGRKYKFSSLPSFDYNSLAKTDMEYFSCSRVFKEDGSERKNSRFNISYNGFIGFSCWSCDGITNFLEEPSICCPYTCFYESETMAAAMYEGEDWYEEAGEVWCNNNCPRLNGDGCFDGWNASWSFEFSGTYVHQGSGPCLLDYLVEVE